MAVFYRDTENPTQGTVILHVLIPLHSHTEFIIENITTHRSIVAKFTTEH